MEKKKFFTPLRRVLLLSAAVIVLLGTRHTGAQDATDPLAGYCADDRQTLGFDGEATAVAAVFPGGQPIAVAGALTGALVYLQEQTDCPDGLLYDGGGDGTLTPDELQDWATSDVPIAG